MCSTQHFVGEDGLYLARRLTMLCQCSLTCTPHHHWARNHRCGTAVALQQPFDTAGSHLDAGAGHVVGNSLAGRRVQQLDLRHDGQQFLGLLAHKQVTAHSPTAEK